MKKTLFSRRRELGWVIGCLVATGLGLSLATAARAVTPALTLTATGGAIGGAIGATAELTGTENASGEITFEVFGPGDPGCAGPPEATLPASSLVTGDGAYSPAPFAPAALGIYHWSAHYSGGGDTEPADSICSALSNVGKATPALAGVASSGILGTAIHDEATVTGGFSPTGQVTFRVFAPGDTSCAASLIAPTTVSLEAGHAISPDYLPEQPGEFRWTAEYSGDEKNEPLTSACGAPDHTSIVGKVAVTLTASANSGPVGSPLAATATISTGAIPTGQITFRAFPPSDGNCSGTPSFRSSVAVSGSGSYRSAGFAPARVGTFHWTVAYSGDANHNPSSTACLTTTSRVSQAQPSIAGKVRQRPVRVGTRFRDTATLSGAYSPSGTITFRIFGPTTHGCRRAAFIDTVAVNRNGTFKSDPFLPPRPGVYRFVASYSGDTANQGATEPCDAEGQSIRVLKRAPKVRPRALLTGRRRISIRARLSGASAPSGAISFRLYRPGDRLCKHRPAFGGNLQVRSNGIYSLAEYLASRPGLYRLEVGYSGDRRNKPYETGCGHAQTIRVG